MRFASFVLAALVHGPLAAAEKAVAERVSPTESSSYQNSHSTVTVLRAMISLAFHTGAYWRMAVIKVTVPPTS